MATGKVKWFNNAKGYGFILPEAGGEDLFAHYSSIEMDGYKTLKAGQQVEFEIMEGPKGHHAVNIHAGAEEETGDDQPPSAQEGEPETAPADSFQASNTAPLTESSS